MSTAEVTLACEQGNKGTVSASRPGGHPCSRRLLGEGVVGLGSVCSDNNDDDNDKGDGIKTVLTQKDRVDHRERLEYEEDNGTSVQFVQHEKSQSIAHEADQDSDRAQHAGNDEVENLARGEFVCGGCRLRRVGVVRLHLTSKMSSGMQCSYQFLSRARRLKSG